MRSDKLSSVDCLAQTGFIYFPLDMRTSLIMSSIMSYSSVGKYGFSIAKPTVSDQLLEKAYAYKNMPKRELIKWKFCQKTFSLIKRNEKNILHGLGDYASVSACVYGKSLNE